MWAKRLSLLGAVACLLISWSAAANLATTSKPDWIDHGRSEDGNYKYFVGISSEETSLEKATDKARQDARKQIFEHVGVTGKATYTQQRTQSGVVIDDRIELKTPLLNIQKIAQIH